jgi:hypothetical protein
MVQLKADVQIKTAFLIEIFDSLALKLHHDQVAISPSPAIPEAH